MLTLYCDLGSNLCSKYPSKYNGYTVFLQLPHNTSNDSGARALRKISARVPCDIDVVPKPAAPQALRHPFCDLAAKSCAWSTRTPAAPSNCARAETATADSIMASRNFFMSFISCWKHYASSPGKTPGPPGTVAPRVGPSPI